MGSSTDLGKISMNMKGIQSMQASRAMKGVQNMAKGVGDAFTGGRDLHQLLHALHSTVVAVEAYFAQPCFARVLPTDLRSWANSLCGEAREAHGRLRFLSLRYPPCHRNLPLSILERIPAAS